MIADDPYRQIRVPIQQKWCFRAFGLGRQGIPEVGQILKIAGQFLLAVSFGNRPNDDAHPLGTDFFGQRPQAGTFLAGFDPARYADIVDTRHHHHISSRYRKMGGRARPFRSHRVLDDLDHDFGAHREIVFRHQPLKRLARKNIAGV